MSGTVEARARLDVRKAFRDGWFKVGAGSCDWQIEGNRLASLLRQIRVGTDRPIELAWTAMHFGGQRAWWVCAACRKRYALLYRGPSGYRCRRCLKLKYETQLREPTWRLQLKAERIYERLGGNLYEGRFEKPSRMRWATFNSLREKADAAHEASWTTGLQRFEKLIGREGM